MDDRVIDKKLKLLAKTWDYGKQGGIDFRIHQLKRQKLWVDWPELAHALQAVVWQWEEVDNDE